MGVFIEKLDDLEHCFTYQKPDKEQLAALEALHSSLINCGHTILLLCPSCDDRNHAIRLLRDCRMWANSAIAHRGRY